MEKEKNTDQEIFSKFEQDFIARKKLPKDEKEKIKRNIMYNFITFISFFTYLVIINILQSNVPTDTYFLCLKIFSIILCSITIIMMEISYKKNDNLWILKTIELLVVTFLTIFLKAAYSLYYGQFYKVIIFAIVVYAIYILIKIILYTKKTKRNYLKSLNDIKTIVAKK